VGRADLDFIGQLAQSGVVTQLAQQGHETLVHPGFTHFFLSP
jgi:hypothetical protein